MVSLSFIALIATTVAVVIAGTSPSGSSQASSSSSQGSGMLMELEQYKKWPVFTPQEIDKRGLRVFYNDCKMHWQQVLGEREPFPVPFELGSLSTFPLSLKRDVDIVLLGLDPSTRAARKFMQMELGEHLPQKNVVRFALLLLWAYEHIMRSKQFWLRKVPDRDEVRECFVDVLHFIGSVALADLRAVIWRKRQYLQDADAHFAKLVPEVLSDAEIETAQRTYHLCEIRLMLNAIVDLPLYTAIAKHMPLAARLSRLDCWVPMLHSLRFAAWAHIISESHGDPIREFKSFNGVQLPALIMASLEEQNEHHELEVYTPRAMRIEAQGQIYPDFMSDFDPETKIERKITLCGCFASLDAVLAALAKSTNAYRNLVFALPENFKGSYVSPLMEANPMKDMAFDVEEASRIAMQIREMMTQIADRTCCAAIERAKMITELEFEESSCSADKPKRDESHQLSMAMKGKKSKSQRRRKN